MAELKHNFMKGRMNKDLDERLVPQGEYRHAVNVEVATSESSNMGTLQTLLGNTDLSSSVIDPGNNQTFFCVGSITDEKNDKLYWLLAGESIDVIAEYDYKTQTVSPVVVDIFAPNTIAYNESGRALNFDKAFLITGINIVDDILFWTDNNTEPKRINIPRCKMGSVDFTTQTQFYVRDNLTSINQIQYRASGPIQHEHLTVIKKAPPTAPSLEMINTDREDLDEDSRRGELNGIISVPENIFINSTTGELYDTPISIQFDGPNYPDYKDGDILIIKASGNEQSIRVEIIDGEIIQPGWDGECLVKIISGNMYFASSNYEFLSELEQEKALFRFKFPRFAYRYKYEDGEYSTFSPFTEVAFLPDKFDYLPKEAYNLGMVNRLRNLVIKDFVDHRQIPSDVVAIDILYKESNSPNIYSVKTIKRTLPDPTGKYEEWNANSEDTILPSLSAIRTSGFVKITTEMIHAILPSNQLLRPYDNVPRKALGQELVGNRLVYGNYLQNYNLFNSVPISSIALGKVDSTGVFSPSILDAESDINIEIKTSIRTNDVGSVIPEQYNPKRAYSYVPAKSIKTLRHYQIGVVYIDELGRETPVFSDSNSDKNSIYVNKDTANQQTKLKAQIFNTYPEWAKSFKFYIKETSGEYYNLAMDRWYDAEDGNIWLSFPSAERNKLDLDTYLILKKGHDSDEFISGPARYKVIAIENEAPQFIKTFEKPQPSIVDEGASTPQIIGQANGDGFPLDGGDFIYVYQGDFDSHWKTRLVEMEQGHLHEYRLRFKSSYGVSKAYEIKSVIELGNHPMPNGNNGAYKIVFKKSLGPDVNITSTDGSFATAVTNLELLLSKQEVLSKPEFQGRFFAKIKRDQFIDNFVVTGFGTSSNYNVVQSITSQYINTNIPSAMNPIGYGNGWFGFDPGFGPGSSGEQKISISSDNGATPFCAGGPGEGEAYWDHVSGQSNTTASNGWFIDKIEGFRPFFNSDEWYGHDFKSQYTVPRTNVIDLNHPINKCWLELTYLCDYTYGVTHEEMAINAGGNEDMGMQVQPTGEYMGGGLPQGYLGITDMRSPFYDNNGFQIGPGSMFPSPRWGRLQNTSASNFGRIPSGSAVHGVDANNVGHVFALGGVYNSANYNVITLSKAGYGENNQYNNNANGSNLTSLSHVASSFNMPAATWAVDKVAEMDFINAITTPGTIWRWREDPGQVIYRTKTPPFPLVAPMVEFSSSEWSFNQQDYMFNPSEKGVFLYNYANFGDYPVAHDHPGTPAGFQHHNWVSQEMYNGCSAPTTMLSQWTAGTYPPEDGLIYHSNSGEQPLETSGGWGSPSSTTIGCPGVGNLCTTSSFGIIYETDPHHRYPCNTLDWDHSRAKRRRYTFYAESLQTDSGGQTYSIGQVGPHYYSPTNDSTLDAHFDVNGAVLTGTNLPTTPAPGIRNDGMYSGHAYPGGSYSFNSITETTIPHLKKVDSSSIQSPAPGSVTWQVLSPYFSYDDENPASTNPAIWETEPKEEVDLDIYYEVGQTYPIKLDNNTNEQFLGPIHAELKENSYVTCYDPAGGTVTLDTHPGFPAVPIPNNDDIRVFGAVDDIVLLTDVNGAGLNHDGSSGPDFPPINSRLVFTRANGSKTETTVIGYDMKNTNGYILDTELHNYEVTLPWHNCYSFGNGVESDRIRDDFNQVTIDNGAKASTVLEEPYLEERRSSGLIYSGIYNSVAGINNLNQFIQAEKITKDLNPTYGSIQKLHQRNFTLTAFCEDRVLKILANKDALYNADGNPQLISTNRVLGEAQPYAGEYGISKNPESFATENFRAYFTDKSRGAVLRLSKDGLTPISDAGMHDWFSDKLPLSNRIYGSFDDRKKEYNISLNHTDFPITLPPTYSAQYYAWVLANCKTLPCDNSAPDQTWKPTNKITVDLGTNVQVGSLVQGAGVADGAEILNIQNVTYDGIDMLELELSIAGGLVDVASLGGVGGVITITSGAGCVDCLGYWNTRLIFYNPSEVISTYTPPADSTDTTVSFSEINRGWVSFKSWIAENAISLNNSYYTIKNGDLWEHHTNLVRNNFHNTQSESSVTVMLNEQPGSVKSFQTLNYEGSQAKVTENLTDSGEYWDNYAKNGWYVSTINSDLQEGDIQEFKEKEGKWFSQVKGQYTEWTDDGTAGNLDGREFSFQGIGQGSVSTTVGGYTSWDCQQNVPVYSKPLLGNEYTHNPGMNPTYMNQWFASYGTSVYIPGIDFGLHNSWIEMGPVDATFNPNPHYVNGVDNTDGHYMSLFGGEWANDTSTTIDGVLASTHPDYANHYNEFGCNLVDITATSSSPNPNIKAGFYITDNINCSTHNNCTCTTGSTVFEYCDPLRLVMLLQNQYGTFGGQLTVAKLLSQDLLWEQETISGMGPTRIGVKDILNANGIDINLVVHHNQIAGSSMPTCVKLNDQSGAYADEPSCLSDVNSPCGLTGTSWECQPVTYACVNPNTGRNVIVQNGPSPDGHNRHGNHQTDCNLPQVPLGTTDAGFQEYLRWFFDVPSRQSFRFEDYASQWCGTDVSGGCINCTYFGWDYIQGDGINTAPFHITPYVMPPKFYTAEEIINYYSTWYPVYLGMNYTQFLDAVGLLFSSPDPDGRIGEQRFLWNVSASTFQCPCPYTNCSNPQNAVTSTGFQCVELLGSTTGPHPDEATCIANSPSCAPIAPCTGTPHDITVLKTDATGKAPNCNYDGNAYIDVILLNGASTWTVEWFDAAGNLLATDPQTYSGNTTNTSFVTLQTMLLAFPPGFIDGDYYIRVTDNFGCFTDTLFTIDCVLPQSCPGAPVDGTCPPHTMSVTQLPATNYPICNNGVISVQLGIGLGCGGNVLGSTHWTIKWFEWDPTGYASGTLLPIYVDGTMRVNGDPPATWNPPDATRQWGFEVCEHGGTQSCCYGLFGPYTPGCPVQPPTPHWSCCDTSKPGYDVTMNGCIDWTNPNSGTLTPVNNCFNDGSGGTGPNGPYYPSQSTCDSLCGTTGSHFSYGCCTDPNGCNDVITSTTANVGSCYGVHGNSLPFEGQDYSFDPALTEAACAGSCSPVIPTYDCCPPASSGCDDWSAGYPTAVLPGECYDPGNGLGAWTDPNDCDANCANVYGCTDPSAVNYCPTCTIDDGSCVYPISYNCINNVCVNPGNGTGTFTALHLCQASCSPGSFPYYECNSSPACQGTNIASFTTYTDYNDCMDDCGPPPPVWMCNGAMSVCQAVAVSNIPVGAVLNVDYFNDVMDCVPTCDYDCSVIIGNYHDMGIALDGGQPDPNWPTPSHGFLGPRNQFGIFRNSPTERISYSGCGSAINGPGTQPPLSGTSITSCELNDPNNNWHTVSWPFGLAATSFIGSWAHDNPLITAGTGYGYHLPISSYGSNWHPWKVPQSRWLVASLANHQIGGAAQQSLAPGDGCDYQSFTKCLDYPWPGAWQSGTGGNTHCRNFCFDFPYAELPFQVNHGHPNYPYNIGGITLHGPRVGGVGGDGSTHPWLATDTAPGRPNGYRQSVVLAKTLVGFDYVTGDTNYKLQAGHNYQLQITFDAGTLTGGGPHVDFGQEGYGSGPNQSKLWINTGHNADPACYTNSSIYASTHTNQYGKQLPHRHIVNGVYNGFYGGLPTNPIQRDWAFYNLGGGCPVMVTFPSWYLHPHNTNSYTWTYNFTAIGPTGNDPTGSDRLNIEQLVIEYETYCESWIQISNICIIEGI